MDKIIIAGMDYDEMYELAYERVREVYDGPEQYAVDDEYFDELVHDEIEEIYIEEVHEIYDAADLKRWFLDYGWTLDRGYGEPNYKERLAEEKNWDLIFDVMLYGGKEKDYIFDGIVYAPVEANDIIIFLEDDFEEEYEDLELIEKSKEEGLKTLGELTQENNIPIPTFYWFNNEYRYKSDSGRYYKNELQDNGKIKSVQISKKDYISNYKKR